MRKRFIWVLALVMLLMLTVPTALAHDHLDSGEGHVIYVGGYLPTEYENGSTGIGVCSYCSEEVAPAEVIPSLSEQRGNTKTPPPAEGDSTPTPAAAVNTSIPVTNTPVPATPTPASVTETPVNQDSGSETATPPVITEEPVTQDTPVPEEVTAPPDEIQATEVPAVIDPSSNENGTLPTAQPTLPATTQTQSTSTNNYTYSGYSGATITTTYIVQGSSGQQSKSDRDLLNYPIFSSRFPWRRLRMNPEPEIQVLLAGRQVWP